MRHTALFPIVLAAALPACSTTSDTAGNDGCEGAKCDDADDSADGERRVCVAVRGNGELIFAHFASLARITEHYGPLWGSAGGSSASITQFILESVQMNPAVARCGDASCSRGEQGERISLLLKSLIGYAGVLGETPEAVAFGQLGGVAKAYRDSGIEALLAEDPSAAQDALLALLQSDDLRDLVNPELVQTITNSPKPAFHVQDIAGALGQLGSFSVGCTEEQAAMGCNPKAIFVRPGLLDFRAIAAKIGRIADFYAGYGPQDAGRMAAWLDGCATGDARGKSWEEIAGLPLAGSTCGAEFVAMLTDYRAALLATPDHVPQRLGEQIGAQHSALVSTSVLTGYAVDAFADARADYLAAEPYELSVEFDDIRFGYWGAADDLAQVEADSLGFDDLKTGKFLPLGTTTWGEILAYSPAEPGLARALELPDGDDGPRVSAGGWSDLAPTLVLANLGCEKTIYVTRRGDESTFAMGIAAELGMDDAERKALFDLDADSSYARSVAEADAVWCTDWNKSTASDLAGVFTDGYGAPMETVDPFFTAASDPYANISMDLGIRGCSPGASG